MTIQYLKSLSKAWKIIDIGLKATGEHEKSSLQVTESRHLRKVGFCNSPNTKVMILEPQTSKFQIQIPKS